MNRKIVISSFLGIIFIVFFIIGIKAYFKFKDEGAIEAANVFISPSHKRMFGKHFTPYPIDGGHRCIELQTIFHKSRKLKLKDADWGAYIFQADSDNGTLLYLALYPDVDGKWGVECWEK